MDSNPSSQLGFHFDILPKATKAGLDFLSQQDWLTKTNWYLAGGTALALQVGHRKSVDLDFFTTDSQFKSESVLSNLSGKTDWKTDIEEPNTIYGVLLGAKTSFIAYPFFIPKQPFIQYGTVKVIQPLDIAVMKIVAVSQRGKKRDFFDLYWCAQNLAPLEEIIKKLPAQYPSVAHDYHHILKSLLYFDDAEDDPEPKIFFTARWTEVKKFFNKEMGMIAKKLIKLQ